MILKPFEELIHRIIMEGVRINSTSELQNEVLSYSTKTFGEKREIELIRKYFLEKGVSPEKLSELIRDEAYYYNCVRESLKWQIKYVLKMLKETRSSRKFIFHNEGCISCLHLFYRKNDAFINTYIRSSNVFLMLPLDIYHIMKMIFEISYEFGFDQDTYDYHFNFNIGSAHLYEEEIAEYRLRS